MQLSVAVFEVEQVFANWEKEKNDPSMPASCHYSKNVTKYIVPEYWRLLYQ